ncbi:MAG: hypothetical protein WCE69_03490 [Aestuariivirga sp.]
MIYRILFAFAVLLISASLAIADGASFNCANARSKDEIAICGNAVLSDIDYLINRAFRDFKPEFKPKRDVARAFVADRNKCESDIACIASVQARTMETYGAAPPWINLFAESLMGRKASSFATGQLPNEKLERPGQCAKTTITKVTTRFGEPVLDSNMDAGTAIEFENGSHQVSYDRAGLSDVKPGQSAVVCMMSRLHDCPEGDDRGTLLLTFDLETGTQWALTDTQHMCGGA